jgi:hypothetical protein
MSHRVQTFGHKWQAQPAAPRPAHAAMRKTGIVARAAVRYDSRRDRTGRRGVGP